MSEIPGNKELSFERAEVEGTSGTSEESATCAFCNTPIRNVYYQVGGAIACAPCRAKKLAEHEGGSAAGRFGRAALFGGGAAVIGALLWYAVAKITGYELGLIAIVIGFLVGTAVRIGSRKRGGWLYQALAIFLTYTSIVSTYIPAIYDAAVSQGESGEAAADGDSVSEQASGEATGAATGEATGHPAAGESSPASPASPAGDTEVALAANAAEVSASLEGAGQPNEAAVAPIGGVLGFLLGIGLLFGIAFIAPFLGGLSNFMGWIIIAIGLYEAWKLNRKETLTFEGPFRIAGARPEYIPEPPPAPIAP